MMAWLDKLGILIVIYLDTHICTEKLSIQCIGKKYPLDIIQ